MSVKHTDELPTDMVELLTMIDKATQFTATELVVTGPIPRNSLLGYMITLGWLARTVRCSPDCWKVHCPTPEIHKQGFRFTTQGRAAHDRLTEQRVTRDGSTRGD